MLFFSRLWNEIWNTVEQIRKSDQIKNIQPREIKNLAKDINNM